MDVMQLEALYEDNDYNHSLVRLASKNLLPFDDFRQEVFSYLAEHGGDVHKVAGKIAKRMQRRDKRERAFTYVEDRDAFSDSDAILWEDRHVLA